MTLLLSVYNQRLFMTLTNISLWLLLPQPTELTHSARNAELEQAAVHLPANVSSNENE